MRILCITPAYQPAWVFGGIVRSTSGLCRDLVKQGADVSVMTTNADGQGGSLAVPVGESVPIGGVEVMYFPPSWGRRAAWASREMEQSLRKRVAHFDILFVAATWQWMGISASRIARDHRVPFILFPHGSFMTAALKRSRLKKSLFWHLFLRHSMRAAAAIRFTTEYERRTSRSLTGNKLSFVVPNSLPPTDDGPHGRNDEWDVRARFSLPKDSLILLTVTRADPNKRVDVLIEALQRARQSGLDLRLVVVGPFDNKLGYSLRRLAERLKVSESIVWAGYQSGRILEACYEMSDLFVLPSTHENFCMAAAEAMAHGLPVIISKHVGIVDDVERYGAGVVTEIDRDEVARAIVSLVNVGDRRRAMAEKAREMATRLYSGTRVARLVLQACEDVLSGSRSPECTWE